MISMCYLCAIVLSVDENERINVHCFLISNEQRHCIDDVIQCYDVRQRGYTAVTSFLQHVRAPLPVTFVTYRKMWISLISYIRLYLSRIDYTFIVLGLTDTMLEHSHTYSSSYTVNWNHTAGKPETLWDVIKFQPTLKRVITSTNFTQWLRYCPCDFRF